MPYIPVVEGYKNFEVTNDYVIKYFPQKIMSDYDFRNITVFFKIKPRGDWEVNFSVENVLDRPLSAAQQALNSLKIAQIGPKSFKNHQKLVDLRVKLVIKERRSLKRL